MSRKLPKKLIEVALPLDDINKAGAREKAVRQGHPSGLHQWWARRPLGVSRAILFAQLVNDPGGHRGYGPGLTKEQAAEERERLFDIVRDLARWENTNNEEVLERARREIRRSWEETCKITGDDPAKLPPFHDPFAGGGAIPLEAQRLGLEAHASDLNPVATLISKAMVEIAPRFAGRPPVGPISQKDIQRSAMEEWLGAGGLAEDIHRYGTWMRDQAKKLSGHLYPKAQLPEQFGGGEATVIAWLWARTVESPNPAFRGVQVPLLTSFWLSRKKGKEVWLKPLVEGRSYRFEVQYGKPSDRATVAKGTKPGRGATFNCILSGSPIGPDYIKACGKAGEIGRVPLAVAVEQKSGRVYLAPEESPEGFDMVAESSLGSLGVLSTHPQYMGCVGYGLTDVADLFTARQAVIIETLVSLLSEVIERVRSDAIRAGWPDDETPLSEGGGGALAYGQAVATYLALAIDKLADLGNTLVGWEPDAQCPRHLFGRQAIPMVWDFAEANPLSHSSGGWLVVLRGFVRNLAAVTSPSACVVGGGAVEQRDARDAPDVGGVVVSTDPPYYDNVPYADLSDFFYPILRRGLRDVFPALFETILTPKSTELVADNRRHGGKDAAETFFLEGMTEVFRRLAEGAQEGVPLSVYYAFKQSDTSSDGTVSTGWVTFLEAVLAGGLAITGTWPVRTENSSRLRAISSNALASSIVLVCRPRLQGAPAITRRDLLSELNAEIPQALEDMTGGHSGQSPVAPVDLAQASIGPGMAVFSRYQAVLEADGSPMTVHTALTLINKAIDDYFTQAEGVMDADTRFCVEWFKEFGFKAGKFGEADVLARAKGTSVEGLQEAGVVESGKGNARLLAVDEYPQDWDPRTDSRVPIWEACHHLSRALSESEAEAGRLLARMPEKQEPIRQLAYRLYTVCERKGWAEDAGRYNELVTSWHAIVEASHQAGHEGEQVGLEL